MLDKAQVWFRRWFGKVWRVRGGGLYAVGYALTFVYLEVRTVIVEFIEADSIGSFFSEQLIEFVFRFAIDSLENMIMALMWPIDIVTWQPPFGAIGFGLAYMAFATFLKKPITDWLFPETEQDATE